MTPLVIGQSLPDCVNVSCSTGRLFWTNIGRTTSAHDDSVHSAKLDVSDIQTILHPGSVNTPKIWSWVKRTARFTSAIAKGWACTGATLTDRATRSSSRQATSIVPSIAATLRAGAWVSPSTPSTPPGYIYWTQKGPSKAGRSRIFRAGLEIPASQTAENRTDIQLLLDGLPEPIDLDLYVDSQRLYWTDGRGTSSGCSLNRVDLSGSTRLEELKANNDKVARHFNEPTGLRVADGGAVYVGDFFGGIYCVKYGEKTLLWRGRLLRRGCSRDCLIEEITPLGLCTKMAPASPALAKELPL